MASGSSQSRGSSPPALGRTTSWLSVNHRRPSTQSIQSVQSVEEIDEDAPDVDRSLFDGPPANGESIAKYTHSAPKYRPRSPDPSIPESDLSAASDMSEPEDEVPTFYQTKSENWWFRPPHVRHRSRRVGKQPKETAARSSSSSNTALPGQENVPNPKFVKLQWARRGEKPAFSYALPPDKPNSGELESHIVWHHSQKEKMDLEELEDLVDDSSPSKINGVEQKLTERLLGRVRKVSERQYISGAYCVPVSLLYCSQDTSKLTADTSCAFLNFPYFSVSRAKFSDKLEKTDTRHPVRSLLQSQFRSSTTKDRDQTQCLRKLQACTLRYCIDTDAKYPDAAHLTGKRPADEIIYVPQLWSLIVGNGTLMTYGSISEHQLRGSALVGTTTPPNSREQLSMVRIMFTRNDKQQSMAYPLEQCNSFFGLLNKKHKILQSFDEENNVQKGGPKSNEEDKERKNSSKTTKAGDYRLYFDKCIVTPRTWCSMLRSQREANSLDLWMQNPEAATNTAPDSQIAHSPSLSSSGDMSGSEATMVNEDKDKENKVSVPGAVPGVCLSKPDTYGPESRVDIDDNASEAPSQIFESLNPTPIIEPFLAWAVLDEYGNEDASLTREVRISRTLKLILESLDVSIKGHGPAVASHLSPRASAFRSAVYQEKKAARPHTEIAASRFEDIQKELGDDNDESTRLRRKTLADCKKLWNLYIPADYTTHCAASQAFWGAVALLINPRRKFESYSFTLCEVRKEIRMIMTQAKKLHLGVYCEKHVQSESGVVQVRPQCSSGAILLVAVVDALSSIFNMFVEIARFMQAFERGDSPGSLTLNTEVPRYAKEAHRLLTQAESQLIVEADRIPKEDTLGPVATPEGLLIRLMDRLARGVYGRGTVDVTRIYEENLQMLMTDVDRRASRGVMLKINEYQEQIGIVADVLRSQRQVLIQYRNNLNPRTWDTPSAARRMNYVYEKKAIANILKYINTRLSTCEELRSRAVQLATQTVHAVETKQEGNGRAILVFTLITLIFSPLTFVSGFFGMNLKNIVGTDLTSQNFWEIAIPFTTIVMALCIVVLFYNSIASLAEKVREGYQNLVAAKPRKTS